MLDNDTAASGAPEITGAPMDGSGDPEPQHGLTLTVDTTGISDADGLTAPGYMYQWIRVDGSNEDDIPGATVATYTAVLADVGMKLKVKVIFTDDGGAAETLTSMATASVVAQSVISFRSSTASVTEGDVQGVLLTLDLSPHARGSGTVQLLSEGQNGATPAEVMGMPRSRPRRGSRCHGSPLTVTEEDTTGDSYTVVLDTEPTADVTVDGRRARGHGRDSESDHPDLHVARLGHAPDGDGDGGQRWGYR